MSTKVYQLYSSNTSSATVYVDILRPGKLSAVAFAVEAEGSGASTRLEGEVSFNATAQMEVHNPQGPVFGFRENNDLQTAVGYSVSRVASVSPPLNIPLKSGDRVYLHHAYSGLASARSTAYLYVEE